MYTIYTYRVMFFFLLFCIKKRLVIYIYEKTIRHPIYTNFSSLFLYRVCGVQLYIFYSVLEIVENFVNF